MTEYISRVDQSRSSCWPEIWNSARYMIGDGDGPRRSAEVCGCGTKYFLNDGRLSKMQRGMRNV